MCGIAGFWGKSSDTVSSLNKMVNSLAPRGPDGLGKWTDIDAGIGLAHARLSIIDLSDAAHQPMSYLNGRYWITYNGEIFNYEEIRSLLEREGYRFTTHSDTEVILGGWACWGIDVLRRLRGMFAFAIWDREKQQLVLFRDRLGIKPLLYSETSTGIVFASTIKSLVASGLIDASLSVQAIIDIMVTGSVCQPGTIIQNVVSLQPGCGLIINNKKSIKKVTYWNLNEEVERLQSQYYNISYSEAVGLTKELLNEACKYHLVADVPIGTFLSGGLDSSVTTAMMARLSSYKVKSFTIGFSNTSSLQNELEEAKKKADYIGTDHREIIVDGEDVDKTFDDFIRIIDQPSDDGLNTFLVSRAAVSDVKVVFSGLGSDEVFAGYSHFSHLYYAEELHKWSLRSLSTAIMGYLYPRRPNRWSYAVDLYRMMPNERYVQLRRNFSTENVLNSFLNSVLRGFDPEFQKKYINTFLIEGQNSITQTSLVELRNYLLNTLLRDTDAISAGQGLEARPMLIDHKLVEHILALPPEHKINGSSPKKLLRDAVSDLLPPYLLANKKKGFTLPTGNWLRNDLRNRMLDVLDGKAAKQLFKMTFIDHCKNNIDNPQMERTMWILLVMLSWLEDTKLNINI